MESFLFSSHRVYFDEYEKLGDTCPPKHNTQRERYIVPKDTTYAIEVTLTKGFNYGNQIGIYVKVANATTNLIIGQKFFAKDPYTTILDSENIYLVENLDRAIINKVQRDGVALIFQELAEGQF